MARTALYFFLLTTIIGCKSTIKFTISAQDVVSPVFVAKKIDIQYQGSVENVQTNSQLLKKAVRPKDKQSF